MALAPRITIDGDRVQVHNFRNFDYLPDGEPLPRYEERAFDLARLESVDYFMCHWSGPAMAYNMVSFGFGDDRYLCLSVEARKEVGERYSALLSFFRRFELIDVIGDERDLVRLRTAIRKEAVYLYRVRVPPERMRRFLLACLRRAESVAVRPEWYNALHHEPLRPGGEAAAGLRRARGVPERLLRPLPPSTRGVRGPPVVRGAEDPKLAG